MAHGSIDTFASPTIKDLRERWWGPEFTEFLTETLKPRPGNRILDVGCGAGTGEISIGRLHLSQIRLTGIDLAFDKVLAAKRETASHNQRAGFAAADACHLPFRDGVFDSTYCVAVLQHVRDVTAAVADFARVTRAGGRVVAVEPDNATRFVYSSAPAGVLAFQTSFSFFAALAGARGDGTDPSIGPKLPALFAANGIEPIDVRLFPVSHVQLGAPPDAVWASRRAAVERATSQSSHAQVRALGDQYLQALDAYAAEARKAGPSLVEIQHTMLFATVGQKSE